VVASLASGEDKSREPGSSPRISAATPEPAKASLFLDRTLVDPASKNAERSQLLECQLFGQLELVLVGNRVPDALETAGSEVECALLASSPRV
jgi:hypothetical protein